MSEEKKAKEYRFFHRLPGRRMSVPDSLQKLLVAAGEKRMPKFGADRIFTTKVVKVVEFFKKHEKHGVDFNYVESAEELQAIKAEEQADYFISELIKMPALDHKMVLSACNDIQTRAWAKKCAIPVRNSNNQLVSTDVLKKKIDAFYKDKEEAGPVEKTQPQDEVPQADKLKKG